MTSTAPLPVASATTTGQRMRYGGLIAMMLMSFLLVTAVFMPDGVLIETAASLARRRFAASVVG